MNNDNSKQVDALAIVVQRELAAMNNVKLDLISRMEAIEARLAKLEQFAPTQYNPIDKGTHWNCGVCGCSHHTERQARNCMH